MNRTEESLREFAEDFNFEEMQDIKMSDKVKDNIWDNIRFQVRTESKNIETEDIKIFEEKKKKTSFTSYFMIAAILTLSITVLYLYSNDSVPENRISMKMGGSITPSKDSLFQIVKSTNDTEYVSLKDGELDIYVVPLKKGEAPQRFDLETKDGFVSVKGTKFTVKVDKTGTTVFVKKGIVWVQPKGEGRDKIVLTKGESTKMLPLDTFLSNCKRDGVKAYTNQNYKLAKEILNKYTLNKKSDYNIITILARIAESEKRYEDSITLYKKVLANGSDLEKETAWIATALLLKKNNQRDRAKKMFSDYLIKFPSGVFKDDVYKELRIQE